MVSVACEVKSGVLLRFNRVKGLGGVRFTDGLDVRASFIHVQAGWSPCLRGSRSTCPALWGAPLSTPCVCLKDSKARGDPERVKLGRPGSNCLTGF